MDYMFMGEETGGKTLAVFVAKDRSSRALMSTVVTRKSTGEFVSKRVLAFKEVRLSHGLKHSGPWGKSALCGRELNV